MKLKKLVFFLVLVSVHATALHTHASELQKMDYEVLAWGDQSGFVEETFLVARTEDEWTAIWEKHTLMDMTSSPYPEVDFSENMVICAFMGRCPTAGYRVSIEGMWLEPDHILVELVKHSPGNQTLVAQVITYPHIFALLESSDVPVIFDTSVESEVNHEPLIPERYSTTVVVTTLLVFSSLLAVLSRKATLRHRERH